MTHMKCVCQCSLEALEEELWGKRVVVIEAIGSESVWRQEKKLDPDFYNVLVGPNF